MIDREHIDGVLNDLITKYHPKAQKGVKRFEVTDWYKFGLAVWQAAIKAAEAKLASKEAEIARLREALEEIIQSGLLQGSYKLH